MAIKNKIIILFLKAENLFEHCKNNPEIIDFLKILSDLA